MQPAQEKVGAHVQKPLAEDNGKSKIRLGLTAASQVYKPDLCIKRPISGRSEIGAQFASFNFSNRLIWKGSSIEWRGTMGLAQDREALAVAALLGNTN
jgi:hypothetical protein